MSIGYVATKSQWDILKRELDIINDYLSLKLTLPLGNRALKQVHTNQFLWCDLPREFKLDYMNTISDVLQGSETRYSYYEEGRWYISGVTINNDGSKFSMDLDLQPFASTLTEYRDAYHGYVKAYTDATKKTTSSSSSSSSSSSTPKSTGNTTLKGGQGKTIDDLVKSICGNTTDELSKCKAIHSWLQSNVKYSEYCCCKYANNPAAAYNNRSHLNCGDTAILTCSMMKSAGLNAYIVHRTYNGGHFWCIIEIGGKKYASDQTGSGSPFNTVWSYSGRANTSITSYSHKESGLDCGCGYYAC